MKKKKKKKKKQEREKEHSRSCLDVKDPFLQVPLGYLTDELNYKFSAECPCLEK